MNNTYYSHRHQDPAQALRHGVTGKYFKVNASGDLKPTQALISQAVQTLGITPAKGNPFWRYLLAYLSSAIIGYLFWGPFIITWLEELPFDHYLMGSIVSMIVLLSLSKLFEFSVAAGFENWRQRNWAYLATLFIIMLSGAEFAAIAMGLSHTHSFALDPLMRYMPYLAGALITFVNLGKALYLARNHVKHTVIYQMTDQLLNEEPYKSEAESLLSRYQTMKEELYRDRSTLSTPIHYQPVSSAEQSSETPFDQRS